MNDLCEWPGDEAHSCQLPAGHPERDHWYGRCDKTPGCRFRMFHGSPDFCWTGPSESAQHRDFGVRPQDRLVHTTVNVEVRNGDARALAQLVNVPNLGDSKVRNI